MMSFSFDESFDKDTVLHVMRGLLRQIREIVASAPPEVLLDYIYRRYMDGLVSNDESDGMSRELVKDFIIDVQLLLECVHASFCATLPQGYVEFTEEQGDKLFKIIQCLRQAALQYARLSSMDEDDEDRARIKYLSLCKWFFIRGKRYQKLEEEFLQYVLLPHNESLKQTYGLDGREIAGEWQKAIDNYAFPEEAIEILTDYFKHNVFKCSKGIRNNDIQEEISIDKEYPLDIESAIDDLFYRGSANILKHTRLPVTLLEDLAFERGSDTSFFDEEQYAGTLCNTLPIRKKPLVKLNNGYYIIDIYLFRDVFYRALLHGLVRHNEGNEKYREIFKVKQQNMSEDAFVDILSSHLKGAEIYKGFYYKENADWVENDVLILIDDVLFLIEAKSGSEASIVSPAVNFDRHVRSIKDLIIRAYYQCKRFLSYLDSADQVPIYQLVNGRYVEQKIIRKSDYRQVFPIGLTVESLAPFSTYCKHLGEIEPLQGGYGFISMSIDDLFVLRKCLPSLGEFVHYLSVRQSLESIKNSRFIDEFDYLGAYLKHNRFDLILQDLDCHNADDILVMDMDSVIHEIFDVPNMKEQEIPRRKFPRYVNCFVNLLDGERSKGWLFTDNFIRNLDDCGVAELENGFSLSENLSRSFPSYSFAARMANGSTLLFLIKQKNADIGYESAVKLISTSAIFSQLEELFLILIERDEVLNEFSDILVSKRFSNKKMPTMGRIVDEFVVMDKFLRTTNS